VIAYAQSQRQADFTMFGEVFDGSAEALSHYTTAGQIPSVLDFGLHGAIASVGINGGPTNNLRDLFANDDYFTDADSNAYQLATFVSNHDGGIERTGYALRRAFPAASDAELVQRMTWNYAMLYFARGFPVIYYGDEQGFVGGGSDKLAREDMMPSLVPEYMNNDLIGTDATPADANFDTDAPALPGAGRAGPGAGRPTWRCAAARRSTATALTARASTPSRASSATSRSSTWWPSTARRPNSTSTFPVYLANTEYTGGLPGRRRGAHHQCRRRAHGEHDAQRRGSLQGQRAAASAAAPAVTFTPRPPAPASTAASRWVSSSAPGNWPRSPSWSRWATAPGSWWVWTPTRPTASSTTPAACRPARR
jgi:hypothetical protein